MSAASQPWLLCQPTTTFGAASRFLLAVHVPSTGVPTWTTTTCSPPLSATTRLPCPALPLCKQEDAPVGALL